MTTPFGVVFRARVSLRGSACSRVGEGNYDGWVGWPRIRTYHSGSTWAFRRGSSSNGD